MNYELFCNFAEKFEMLEVKDATIAVGGKTLATGLSFIARDGELTCITGPQGSGKTTLLRTLMGFLPVGEGFVSVDGELLTVYSAHAFRTLMTYLPQQMEVLKHQLTPPEAPEAEADEYAVWGALLPSVQAEQQPEPLSSEEIFRLAEQTIREAGSKPILIADEPAVRLTPELTQRLIMLLQEQTAQGKTVLVASRNPLIVSQANQVISLEFKV
jgi:ABC-type multidrug transport system ATPase subunit